MKSITRIIAFAGVAAAMVACHKEDQWTVEGSIAGAPVGNTVVLEASDAQGNWYTLDTLTLTGDGMFKASRPAVVNPDIYRLNYEGQYIYFPVDSMDHLSIVTSAQSFDKGFNITGSASADRMMQIEKRINEFVAANSVEALDTARMFKRELATMLLEDPAGIVSYYTVNRNVGGRRLFRPEVKSELAIIGAIANAFTEYRPNDPRTQFLANSYLNNRPRPTEVTDTIQAGVNLIEIELINDKGKETKLSQVAAANKVVLLNFTNYKGDYSQALNLDLKDLYNKYHSQGLEIFQVGFDESEFDWRMAAEKMPWVTVYNGVNQANLINYNVGGLPAIFIFKNGELVDRVKSMDALRNSVERYL